MSEPFILDLDSNPHPLMLASALAARALARRSAWDGPRWYWHGYLTAMCDATGCMADDIEAWMDRHET